jgi:ATP-dependent Lhr-like helicase
LLLPAAKRQTHAGRRRRGGAVPESLDLAGRWAPVRRPVPPAGDADKRQAARAGKRTTLAPEVLEHIVMALLHRYGVVFWRLLDREPDWLPPWRDLLPVLHRLEARGDVRGGRFVAGLAGGQFALPEAIPLLRQVRRTPLDGSLVRLSGVDPLNLCGTLLPGEKIPALAGNRVLFRDGLPIAALIAGKMQNLAALEPVEREAAHAVLIGRA